MLPELNINQNSSVENICLAGLICHVGVLLSLENIPGLLSPLTDIYFNPSNLTQSLFPTMPDHNLHVIRSSVRESGSWGECDNGHPHFITHVSKYHIYMFDCLLSFRQIYFHLKILSDTFHLCYNF